MIKPLTEGKTKHEKKRCDIHKPDVKPHGQSPDIQNKMFEKEKCELLGIIQGKDEVIAELKAQLEKIKTCSRCMSNNKDLEEYPCKNCFKNGVYTKWH